MTFSLPDLQNFLDHHFPENSMQIEEIGPGTSVVRLRVLEHHRRPGDTVSGPALMTLADAAVYLAILGSKGPEYIPCATAHLSIHFLRRPALRDLLARASLLKVGRSLIVGDVSLFSEGEDEPSAFATVTYAVPPSLTKESRP